MTAWYHMKCIFHAQQRARSWKITDTAQLDRFEELSAEDKDAVRAAMAEGVFV